MSLRISTYSLALSIVSANALAAEDKGQLEEITVTGERLDDTEESYIRSDVSSGKSKKSLKETPQSISIISRQQMDEQGAKSVQDSLRYSSGVHAEAYGLDIRGDYGSIRGSEVGVFRDGLQSIFSQNTTQPRPSLWGVEKVEVLKGPSSMLYGQSSLGGLVNLISKKPLTDRKGQVEIQLGSYNRQQLSLDITGPIDEEKTLSYRILGQVRDAEAYVELSEDDSSLFAPSLRWQPNRDSSLTLLLHAQRDDGKPTSQFHPINGSLNPIATGRIPMDRNIGEPGFDEQVATQRVATLIGEHRFNEVWSYHQTLAFTDMQSSYQQIYRSGEVDASGNIGRTSWVYKSKTKALATDAHVNADLDHGLAKSTVLFGIDYQKATVHAHNGFAAQNPINVYKPHYGNYIVPTLNEVPKYSQEQTGLYLQGETKLWQRFGILLGTRRDKASNEGASFVRVDNEATTSRAALSYDLTADLSSYVSFSESFTPNAGLDASNKPFDPREGQQTEIGMKYQSQESRSLVTLAYYQLTEKNRLASDPNNINFSAPLGEVEIKGAELEALFDLSMGWSGTLAYTYTDSEQTETPNPSNKGKRLAATPETLASLWLDYRVPAGGLKGFGIGAGVRHVGESWDGTDSNKVPDYTLYDALLSYAKGAWLTQLNANNIADKTYFTTCRIWGDCFYGNRRMISVSSSYFY